MCKFRLNGQNRQSNIKLLQSRCTDNPDFKIKLEFILEFFNLLQIFPVPPLSVLLRDDRQV